MKKLSLAVAFFAIFAISAFSQVPKEIKGGVLNGKATSLPKPEYPESAKAAGLEGTVYVNVVIDEGGNVVSATADDQPRKVTKQGSDGQPYEEEQPPADIILRDAAERAAWNARFSPTMLNGIPVKVTGTIVYNFVSKENRFTALGSGNSGLDRVETVGTKINGTISGGVLNSKTISMPMPGYPPAAKAVRAQGAVSVQVTVDPNGDVTSAFAVSGHPLLRAAAVKAAKEAKFSPTLVNGPPVNVTGVLVYNFVAPDEEN